MIPENIKLLIDLILGDGWLGHNGNSIRGRIEHSIKQKEYAQYKEHLLKTAQIPLSTREYTATAGKSAGFSYYQINLHQHADLHTAYKYLYNRKKKSLDKSLLAHMDNRSLAFLFMDDGYAKPVQYLLGKYERFDYAEAKTHCYRISTNCFTYDEHILFQDWLLGAFAVRSSLEKQGQTYRTVITDERSKDHFRDAIRDFIVPSMQYKIMNRHNFKDVPFIKSPRYDIDRNRLSGETSIIDDATVEQQSHSIMGD